MKYIILFLSLFSTACFSQDNPLEEAVKQQISYNGDDYFAFDLKVLPNNPSLAIFYGAKFNTTVYDDNSACDLILLLIDTKTQKVINTYKEESKFVSDAYHLSGISLDMANYTVNENYRAFGVRSSFSGSSQVYPAHDQSIDLFIIKNNKIERIMDTFEISSSHGDWDTKCRYDGEEIDGVLIMQPEKTNGFYNIKVKSTKTIRKTVAPKTKDGDCIDMDKKLKPAYQNLQYNNGTYILQKKTVEKAKKK